MKKAAFRRLACVLILAAVMSCLSGCGGSSLEKIFSRTVHDFAGQPVVQLGEAEDKNFLVYAENVQQIQTSEECNRVVSRDPENMVYTIENPDETLLAMEPGDVFFSEATPENSNAIVVKLKQMELGENQVKVYGDRVAMEDLFTHVNIDMEMPLEQAYIQNGMPGEPDYEVDWSASVSPNLVIMTGGMDVDLGLASNGGNIQGKMHYQASNQFVIRKVQVQILYDKQTNSFFSDVQQEIDTVWEASLAFEGNWSSDYSGTGKAWPKVSFFIPHTPIQVGVETSLQVDLTGSMSGSFSQTESFRLGMSSTYRDFVREEPNVVWEPTGKVNDAKLELEGTAEITYGIQVHVGIPFVVDLFLEGGIGVRATGSQALLGGRPEEDSVHDCDLCIDGDFEVFLQANVGVDLRIVSLVMDKDLVIRKNLAEISVKIGDFYASYRDEGVECGFGECPHLRWKVTVTVKNNKGKSVAMATVRAQYPDGRTDEKMTDESGKAVLYLPNGDNLLNCASQGQKGNTHVYVENEPTTETLKLDKKQQLFVLYRFFTGGIARDSFDFTELRNVLEMNYPDAVYIHINEWLQHIQNSANQNLVLGNHSAEGLTETYGMSEGDVLLFVQAHQGVSDVWGYKYFTAWVATFLLPENAEETGDPTQETTGFPYEQDIPYMWSLYQLDAYTKSDVDWSGSEGYVSQAYYEVTEKVLRGLEINQDFRIQKMGTGWSDSTRKDAAPGVGMHWKTFENSYTMHHDNLTGYVFRTFPYIDAILNGSWNESVP